MLQLLNGIPFFVWPIFAILLIGGLKARKTNHVPLLLLLLIPTFFLGWSVMTFFGRYLNSPLALLFWVICLGMGFFIGYFNIQKMDLSFNKKKRAVQMPGSWLPLILSMSVFTAKLSSGMIRAVAADPQPTTVILILELFATIIMGIFLGRGLSCFIRYRAESADQT